MKVLLISPTGLSEGSIAVVFGCGLIGSRILKEFEGRQAECLLDLKASWKDEGVFRKQCREVVQLIKDIDTTAAMRVHFVWSAGSGSFASDEKSLVDENRAFEFTLNAMRSIAETHRACFHFTSSAGGLFEGQRLIGRETRPKPLRPYGSMKLEQENALLRLAGEAGFKVRIYRPSTVYGTHEFGFRTGLVSHLFWNALRNSPTTLEANFHALRDYVHAGDVAAYIANRVAPFEAGDREVHFLVSGKPSSIFEIAGLVERMLGRTLVLRYSDRTQNDRDITFRADVMPPSWRPHDLETGLRAVYRNTSFLYLRDVPFDLAVRT